MIIKCKMCGGDMELSADQRTGTCEYCGSTMTLPKVDDDQRAAAFNRGNHFRRIGEFDKALSVYESIVRENEEDAEAHWCCALCRFGIEYVKDPASGEYIPTCHRASFDSFTEDVDCQAAMKYADAVARRQYEQDAEKIAQVQRGILSISRKEEPFDVFICYKESDERGNRTVDSTLAQDIYYQLTEQGRRVFFARITLEDKAGQEYEPYIFAALHSAKVMVVVGTKPEYLNAVWVKNEWSRYLTLMKQDRKRLLIPCYRDMDPYDLPEQLSVLQSYDMGKIGFIQDLIRGIAKVLDADKKPNEKVVERVIEHGTGGVAPGIESLMKRVYLFMEDGDFQNADEYINRVLDIDPEYAPAYVARTCTALHFRRESQLGQATFLYMQNADWKKAIRFADAEKKAIYEKYEQETRERVKRQIRDRIYDWAMVLATNSDIEGEDVDREVKEYERCCERTEPEKRASGFRIEGYEEQEEAFEQAVEKNLPGDVSEEAYKIAAEWFSKIRDGEAEKRAAQCLVLAEQARQKKVYMDACKLFETAHKKHDVVSLQTAMKEFCTIPEYKDAGKLADSCREEANEIQKTTYQLVIDAMKRAGKDSYEWALVRQRLRTHNLDGYQDVEQLRIRAEKEHKQCLAEEEKVRKEKKEQETREQRQKRKKLAIIVAVIAAVVVIGVAVNAKVVQPSIKYKEAVKLMEAGQYDAAYAAFEQMRGYRDVDTLLEDKDYKFVTGKEITFGSYEQDGDISNGAEEIEWIVLNREGDRVLLLSKYGLDTIPYHEEAKSITWEQSTIRSWLNNDFINTAFTPEEQAAILETVVETAVDNSSREGYSGWYAASDGNNTQDKIFLLSYREAFEEYFNANALRICTSTSYAKQESAYTNDADACVWWLRSPGLRTRASSVGSDGSLSGSSVNDNYCVRPALWIDLNSDIF